MSDPQTDEWRQAQIDWYRRQARWELPKAAVTLLAAMAVFCGCVLAFAHWLHPPAPPPQQVSVTLHLDGPVVIRQAPPR
jgi:hypothetical protein